MGEQFDSVEKEIQEHLSKLVKTAEIAGDDPLEQLAGAWLEKQSAFFEQTKQREMEEVEELEEQDARGALILTYSGSLISLGPMGEDGREVEYVSIGLRQDVPESASAEHSNLSVDLKLGVAAEFSGGPITKSSPVYAIAVLKEDLSEDEGLEVLGDVTMMLTQDFVDINKTLIDE
ncbi:hypothetical protein [Salinispira pacifica]|uniref:Uncharacterized protein n=1 Tax=Salinispira pacifica TaxID=1307761 RepID=V5WL53_9SPIO|nr:hypothetical protein [Salinispira pacifica]AHC16385.1 hypothetical protein L21SP2_3041 [Salinispira pacifica]